MQYFAHIQNGIVTSIEQVADDLQIGVDIFTPEIAATMVACDITVQPGWLYDATAKTFAPPQPPVVTPTDLANYANAKQWALATGGYTLTLSGQALTFGTDETSQGLITGKYVRLALPNPPATISWQFPSGFVSVSQADFVKAATAIADFIQATFDALQVIEAAIAAGTITTAAEIDAAAWPSAIASS